MSKTSTERSQAFRERQKEGRVSSSSLSGNKITIDCLELETIEAWQALKANTRLSSARLLKVLIDNAYEVPLINN